MSTVAPTSESSRFRPLPVPNVVVGGFWGQRLDAVADRTADILYDRCVEAGMLEQIDPDLPQPALRIPFQSGHGIPSTTVTMQMFWDSDFGKTIETAAYSLCRKKNPALENKIDAIIDRYGKLQQEDGYLSSWYQRMQPGRRWTNLRDCHELYCAGHLIEGAVAYFQATGKRKLLDILRRYVDHMMTVFGPEPDKKHGYCGHEEIELALVKLARVTGERKYLDFAKYFIDARGAQPHYFDVEARERGSDGSDFIQKTYEYNQSHLPVREQSKIVGHAVRAMYLYSGMADIAREYDDAALRTALESLWADLVSKRLYATAGMGPSARNEGFTTDYDLPNETAYAETCAAVGLVFWSSRMLGLQLNRRYGDIMELPLYNGAISGLSLDGAKFFYENPLESAGQHNRWIWHRCPCCPPNIARMVASIGSYMYGVSGEAIAVHVYGESSARFDIGGQEVMLRQTTRYPWNGGVELAFTLAAPARFTLHLRIPGWSPRAQLAVNGEPIDLSANMVEGYVALRRDWNSGDVVRLDLEMSAERLFAHPAIRADNGRVALRRGPLLYCCEAVDNEAPLGAIRVPREAVFTERFEPDLLDGVVTLSAEVEADVAADWGSTLYRSSPPKTTPTTLRAVPYFAWDNREPGEMSVWLRDAE